MATSPSQPPAAAGAGAGALLLGLTTMKRKQVLCFGTLCLLPYLYLFLVKSHHHLDGDLKKGIILNFLISILAFWATLLLIPVASKHLKLYGYDINKKGTPLGRIPVPESMGSVCGIIYLLASMAFHQFYITPQQSSFQYNASIASICSMLFLGFVDDLIELPWSIKLILPSFSAMHLVMAYSGGTTILIPKPLRSSLGFSLLDLGWIYKLCIALGAIFCTNAVNIFAGINGLEAGQTIIISCAILVYNLIKIGSSSLENLQAHTFSIYLTQPLVGVSLGLLAFNWFPSSVFVGDSYTSFAGMTMAVVSIYGHFSETLVLLMLPQMLNFLYSLPQLLQIMPCPRHRLPRFDAQSGLLTGKKDMNMVNLFLRVFGPCSEYQLFIRLIVFQAVCCVLGILLQA